MRTWSMDLRTRRVKAVDRGGGSQGESATLFRVSRTFGKKLLRQRLETGSVAPKASEGRAYTKTGWRTTPSRARLSSRGKE